MGDLIEFEIGCRHCEHLQQVAKGKYRCSYMVHTDDSEVLPIVDNRHTYDWNVCNGEYYQRALAKQRTLAK